MVYHDLGYSTETIFTGVFKGILHFHRFFKAKNPSSACTGRVCHSAVCCMYVGGTPSCIYVLWVDLAGLHAEPCGGSGPCTTTNPLFYMHGWKP